MNDKAETIKTDDGQEVPLNTWIEKEGERVMYTRERVVNYCIKDHKFNKNHECERCPYVFVGFRANRHIQTKDGIFERKPVDGIRQKLA